MSALDDFLSRRRGAERRAALSKFLNYYIPPNLRPAADFAGSLTPQASYESSVLGFQEALTPGASVSQRVGGVGKGLSGAAGIAAPIAVAKQAGMPAAQAVQEAFQGFSTGANYAGGILADRLNQTGPMPTVYSNPIPGLSEFMGKASKGRVRQARTVEQDISDILSKKMPATVIDLKGASDDLAIDYETGKITDALQRAGLFVSDDNMGKIHVGTTKENLRAIKEAKTPAEIGRLSGYSDDDIAAFYLKRRGGVPELALEDYTKDAGGMGVLGVKSEDVMYHGGNIEGDIKVPFFVTPDEKSAKWYADESGGSISRHSVNIKKPLKVGSQEDNKKFLDILKKNGIDVNDLEDMIFENSPYDGTNILDAAYVPEVRAALKKEGYDSLFNPYDQLENTEIPAYAIIDDSVFSANTEITGGILGSADDKGRNNGI